MKRLVEVPDEVDEISDLQTLAEDFFALPSKVLFDTAQEIRGLVDGPNDILVYCIVFRDDEAVCC